MEINDYDIADFLMNHIKDNIDFISDGFGGYYTNSSVPTVKLPESFLLIEGNGPISSQASNFGICDYNLSLIINVKLKDDGTINMKRMSYLYEQVSNLFKNVITLDKFHYSRNNRSLVYSGRDLVSGYSTKVMNINVKIY